MKDVMCPACNTRSVPFWEAFWHTGLFTSVRCAGCGTRLRYPFRITMAFLLLTYVPAVLIGLVLLFIPYVGIPLAILFVMGLTWLQVRTIKLEPVKKKRSGR